MLWKCFLAEPEVQTAKLKQEESTAEPRRPWEQTRRASRPPIDGKSYYPTHYPTQSPIDEMSHVSPTSSDQCSPTLDEFVDLAGESK